MHSFAELKQLNSEQAGNIQLYRIVKFDRVIELLSEKKLTLLDPIKWEDPYEKAQQDIAAGSAVSKRPSVFGLCWSMRARSDAMWRIYSPDKLGVRISTTVARMLKALDENLSDGLDFRNLFLGRVSYLPEKGARKKPFDFGESQLSLANTDFSRPIFTIGDAIEDMRLNAQTNKVVPRDIAKALYLKRQAFDHESEVRLLYVEPTKGVGITRGSDGLLRLKMTPEELIRGLQFDPRLSTTLFKEYRERLKSVLGRISIRVSQSSLYKGPDHVPAQSHL